MERHLFKEILYCTDFSENANEAFVIAGDLVTRYEANLHIVNVTATFSEPVSEAYIPVPQDVTLMEKAKDAARASIEQNYVSKLDENQKYWVHILSGYPATEIVELAKEKAIDLIVMGSHGLTGLAHVLFGSTADRVVRKAPCSVLAVRLPKRKA